MARGLYLWASRNYRSYFSTGKEIDRGVEGIYLKCAGGNVEEESN